MNARGIDLSENNPWVTRALLADWKSRYGLSYAYRRTYIGSRRDSYGMAHFQSFIAEGYLTGPYGVPFEPGSKESKSLTEQCRLFIASRQPEDTLPNWCDVERPGLTEKMVEDWCDYYDDHTDVPLWIYTSKTSFNKIVRVNHDRYAKYGLVVADYGPGLLTAVPWARPSGRPLIPKPWIFQAPPYYQMWQYAGDNGRLFGSGSHGIDLSEYRGSEADLRSLFGQEPVPVVDPDRSLLAAHAQAILETL